jgi:hypothetical protein
MDEFDDEEVAAYEDSSLGEDDDGYKDKDIGLGNKIVRFRFVDLETYRLMENGLPSDIEGFNIIKEVRNGYLYIRTVPGMVHEKASRAYETPIGIWAQNNTLVADNPPLLPTGSAGMRSSILSANCVSL